MAPLWAVAVAAGTLVAITNRWVGNVGIHPWGGDVTSYERIASAAPGLPSARLGSAYTGRFAVHFVTGLLSDVLGIGLHAAYRVVALLCIVALVVAAYRLFGGLSLTSAACAVALGAFLLNPYGGVREAILAPGGVQDLLFVVGLCVLLWGLTRESIPLVLSGMVLTLLARQTALLVAPVAAIWLIVAPGWTDRPLRRRGALAAGLLALTAIVYGAILLAGRSFTHHFAPSFPHDTILPLLKPSGLHELTAHAARVAQPYAVPGALLLSLLLLLARAGVRPRALRWEFWGGLLMWASIVVQPLFISADFPGFAHNEQRLAGLGLLPLCLALGIALSRAEEAGVLAIGTGATGGLLACFAVASLLHDYAWFGPQTQAEFTALQVGMAAVAVEVAVLGARASPVRRPARARQGRAV